MPDTKPDLWFNDEGVCSACLNYERREDIDWDVREGELKKILEEYKTGDYYDCVVPVSGGKDSHYQVIKMLEYGMNPLCVCSMTDDITPIGRENLDNIAKLGCDLLMVQVNPQVRKKIANYALRTIGDISWAEHVTIFTIPVKIAVLYQIPLIIWGENSQNEYGGPAGSENQRCLSRRWLEEFGGLLGMRVSDMKDQLSLSEKDLLMYEYPSDHELKAREITGLFLGHYLPWDGMQNGIIAKSKGFKWKETPVETQYKRYENLDNHQTGIHDYFKYLKYGFGRTTDLVCTDIRRGRISREQGVEIIKENEGKYPIFYMGKELKYILHDIGMSTKDFAEICISFANPLLFDAKYATGIIDRPMITPLFDVV